MALKPQFEAYLVTLPADAAATLREAAEKVPAIQDSVVGQIPEKMKVWYYGADQAANNGRGNGAYAEFVSAKERAAQLEAAGGEVNREELSKTIDEKLKALGPNATSEQITAMVGAEVTKFGTAAEARFNENLPSILQPVLQNNNAIVYTVADLMVEHSLEFGEKLDRMQLATFMRDQKIDDPRAAYNKMFETRRAEVATTQKAAADKAEADRVNALVEERFKQRMSEAGVPGTGATPHTPGPIELMRTGKGPSLPEGSKLGDNAAASSAAAELIAEGRF